MSKRVVFIVNPAAGKKHLFEQVFAKIEKYIKSHGNCSALLTKGPNDATIFARTEAKKGDDIRIFACGGDGTLNEVLNGAIGFDNVEIGCIPFGSGNDFIKTFGKKEDFLDINAQVNGFARKVDAIKASDRFALNICSMGMDAKVGANMQLFKKIPFVSGSMSYKLSVLYCLASKISVKLKIQIDSQPEISGNYLFALAANGRYYGGGYMGAPLAEPDDGLLDFIIVKAVSRFKVLDYLSHYKKGTHLQLEDIVSFYRGKKMTVTSLESSAAINCDGECSKVKQVIFESIPGAVNFILPFKKILENNT